MVSASVRPPVPNVRLLTGLSGLAVAVLLAAEFVTQLAAGTRPDLDRQAALARFAERTATQTLVVILIDTVLMAAVIVFLGCFRQLVSRQRHELEWVVDIAFGAGLVFVAVTLVGDAIEGGSALDTWRQRPDPSAIRALTEGHMILFGSVGCVLTAVVAGASGYVILASQVLPRWTGIVSYVCGALNLVAVPTMFGGTSTASPFSAGGWGTTAIATFPWFAWVVVVGVVTVVTHRGHRERVPVMRTLDPATGTISAQ